MERQLNGTGSALAQRRFAAMILPGFRCNDLLGYVILTYNFFGCPLKQHCAFHINTYRA